jgi:hypothetical protein
MVWASWQSADVTPAACTLRIGRHGAALVVEWHAR